MTAASGGGKGADMAKKKPIMTNAMRSLASKGIEYEAVEYETDGVIEDHFGMVIAEKTGIPPETSFKTLVLKGEKTGITVACIPVCRELDLKKFAAAAGEKKFEMIHVKDLLALTGYIRGGVSPVGMKKKYPTFIDASCQNHDKIAISAGVCGCTLILKTADVLAVTDAKCADITRKD